MLIAGFIFLLSAVVCFAEEGQGGEQGEQQFVQENGQLLSPENGQETGQLGLEDSSIDEVDDTLSQEQYTSQDTLERPTVTLEKSASPSTVSYGDPVTVTLAVIGTGAPRPVDVVLVIDKSDSLDTLAPTAQNIQTAPTLYNYALEGSSLAAFLALSINDSFPGYVQVAIVTFDGNSSATLNRQLTDSFDDILVTLLLLSIGGTTGFDSDGLAGAINTAAAELQGARRIPGSLMFIGLITDGCPGDADTAAAIAAAQVAKDAGIYIYTVGMGFDPLGSTEEQLLKNIASSDSNYYFSEDLEEVTYMDNLINDLAQIVFLAASNLTITNVLPDYVELVPDSFTVSPSSISGKTITWNISQLLVKGSLVEGSWSVSYQVRMYALGTLDPSPNVTLSYLDYLGTARTQSFPEAYVEVQAGNELPATGSAENQIMLLGLLFLLSGLGIFLGVKIA